MKNIYFLFIVLLSVSVQAQPANDDCDHATVIDTPNFNLHEDATTATNNNGGLDVCGTPAWGMNDGVWFKLTGAGGDVNLTVTPVGWNCQVDVYSGSCGNFTCVLGLNNGVTNEQETGQFFADNGVEYYINVGHWAYDPNDPQADNPEGPFDISVNGAILTGINEGQIQNFSMLLSMKLKTLQLLSQETVKQVLIYDLLGQQVLNVYPGTTQSNIDVSGLQSGLYIVKIKTLTQEGVYKVVVGD